MLGEMTRNKVSSKYYRPNFGDGNKGQNIIKLGLAKVMLVFALSIYTSILQKILLFERRILLFYLSSRVTAKAKANLAHWDKVWKKCHLEIIFGNDQV